MPPTVEEPKRRWYHLRFKDGTNLEIRADVICKPNSGHNTYQLKRDDNIIGEFSAEDVSGWWLTNRASIPS